MPTAGRSIGDSRPQRPTVGSRDASDSVLGADGNSQSCREPTHELVKQVADKVYVMLMHDLRIKRERHPPSAKRTLGKGGW